jgi:hypothetical protein
MLSRLSSRFAAIRLPYVGAAGAPIRAAAP